MATVPDPAPPAYLLWCGECGRSEGRTVAEVRGFARIGWPKCCEQTMGFFAAPDPPSAAPARERTADDAPAAVALDALRTRHLAEIERRLQLVARSGVLLAELTVLLRRVQAALDASQEQLAEPIHDLPPYRITPHRARA